MAIETKEPAKTAHEQAAGDAQRTVDEVRSLLDAATRDDLDERVAEVKQRLEAAREALERVAAEGGALGRTLLGAERSLHNELEEVEKRIRDNPLGALFAAAGAGLLLGLAISRHR